MSSVLKHTPGPWAVYSGDPLVIVDRDGASLGEMSPGDPYIPRQQAEANAALAATSPDLLKALVAMLPSNISALPRTTPDGTSLRIDVPAGVLREAQAAVAKATGEAA